MAGGDSSGDDPPAENPHPAQKQCAQRLNELTAQWRVERISGSGKPLKLTAKGVCELIRQQAPHIAPSQSQVYRYYNAEAAPSIAVVFELARLFNVSPQSFLPESAPASSEHYRLRPI
jgi:transcriptional regulator with XRE-family HTH domain